MKSELPPLSTFTPEQIEAWLDGELDAAQAAVLDELALNESSLQERRRAHEALCSVVAREIPAEPELPYADFFMHQLERRIEDAQLADAAAKQSAQQSVKQTSGASSWKNWLPWGLSAACAAALALVVSLPNGSAPESGPVVAQADESGVLLSAYSPRAQIRTEVKQNQPVIVVLEGLPEYEGEVRGVGLRVSEVEANNPKRQDWAVASHLFH